MLSARRLSACSSRATWNLHIFMVPLNFAVCHQLPPHRIACFEPSRRRGWWMKFSFLLPPEEEKKKKTWQQANTEKMKKCARNVSEMVKICATFSALFWWLGNMKKKMWINFHFSVVSTASCNYISSSLNLLAHQPGVDSCDMLQSCSLRNGNFSPPPPHLVDVSHEGEV